MARDSIKERQKFKAVSVAQMKLMDEEAIDHYGIPAIILMENAGIACAHELFKRVPRPAKIAIFCGAGNNGGDGFVIARHLFNRRYPVTVFYNPSSIMKRDALTNFLILKKLRVRMIDARKKIKLAGYRFLVDSIFGIGLKRSIQEPQRLWVNAINRSGRPVLSVDVPSGLDADTGEILGCCVKADITVTFGALKRGFLKRKARKLLGAVLVRDISLPITLLDTVR